MTLQKIKRRIDRIEQSFIYNPNNPNRPKLEILLANLKKHIHYDRR